MTHRDDVAFPPACPICDAHAFEGETICSRCDSPFGGTSTFDPIVLQAMYMACLLLFPLFPITSLTFVRHVYRLHFRVPSSEGTTVTLTTFLL